MERVSSKKPKGVVVVPILRKRLHSFSGNQHWRTTSTKIAPANINSLNAYQTVYSAQHDYDKKKEYDLTLFDNQCKTEMKSKSTPVNPYKLRILSPTGFGTIGFDMSEISSKHTKPIAQPRIIRLRSHRHHLATTVIILVNS
ncbi:unnamed protein product [Rotaria magnacalcarata]|uniref:Uncharacterized protein n=2 Tax=Rotaria magnacalcarata TaxID=392030 RepID=A0A820EUE9_9BILA|nr:unnamed protein product [Rotaria magnacalcarata]CAF4253880.1 unnamed protein product [Rotaria magnacalcarata]